MEIDTILPHMIYIYILVYIYSLQHDTSILIHHHPTLSKLQVLQLWQAMSAASVPRNVILCSATINACTKGSLWPLALEVLGSMPSSKVNPREIPGWAGKPPAKHEE